MMRGLWAWIRSIFDDRIYAIGTEGDLVCLDVTTGGIRWRQHFVEDFDGQFMAVWKFVESPLVDGERLICAGIPTIVDEAGEMSTDSIFDKYSPFLVDSCFRARDILYHECILQTSPVSH